MGGLRFDSLADLPEGVRQQVAGKILKQKPVAGAAEQKNAGAPKYGNRKTIVDGIRFDSQKEARRYQYLKWAEGQGLIYQLRLQQDFTLQEAFTASDGERHRAIRYKADFTYRIGPPQSRYVIEDHWMKLPTGALVIEDTKGVRTKEYNMKKKMMAEKGHTIYET